MSKEENIVGDEKVDTSGNNSNETAYVSKKAYEEVTRDMHKNKQKAKELEAALNEMQAQLKAQEEQKMQEENRWKELYQKREAELEQERQKSQSERSKYMKSVKLAALKQEIGASIRDEYLQFANLESIALTEDGLIDRDSLREVANSFKKEHGQLIPKTENVNITGTAPSNGPVSTQVDIKKMSADELVKFYAYQKSKSQ